MRKHEPIPKEAMGWVSPENTICQTLREIYWLAKDNSQIQIRCRIATSMAKSMTRKLTEYKHGWEQGFWDDNKYFDIAVKEVEANQNAQESAQIT